MSKLVWGTVEDRMFETGVDRGVLFVQGYDAAPWNGLISVSESPTGGDTTPYYLDGVKYLNHSALEEFAGTIEAFSSPAAFAECDGTYSIHNGLFASNQKRKPFDFSYRTLIGDSLEGTDRGYKIHLIYNALTSPASRSQKTVGSSVVPGTLSWAVTATPVIFPGVRPTSHLVIDSTKTSPLVLTYLEYILYGTDTTMARMPTPSELMALFGWEAPDIDFPVHPKGGLAGAEGFLTNLATNPSFEKTSGTVEVRRNHVLYPSLRGVRGGWSGAGADFTFTDSPNGLILDFTNSVANWTSILYRGNTEVAAAPGDVWSSGLWVEVPAGKPTVSLRVRNYWGAGGFTDGPAVSVEAGQRVRVAVSGDVAPPGATNIRLTLATAAEIPAGAQFIVSDVLAEKAPVLGPFFDGSHSPDPDLTPAWTDVENASASILQGVGVAGAAQTYGGVRIQSGQWSSSGSHSVRFISTRNDTAESMFFAQGSFNNLGGMVPGKTYTASVKLRLEAPLSAFDSSRGLRLAIRWDGGGTSGMVNSDPAPNVAGVHELRVTATIPADATGIIIQLNQWGPGESWWDDLLIVEGEYDGPYFDGDHAPNYARQLTRTTWRDTPNQSASDMYYYPVLADTPARVGDAYVLDDNIWVYTPEQLWQNYGGPPVI